MSDETRKAVLSLIGIAALAAVLLTGVRTETPFQQAVRRLRVGMSSKEARAAINNRKADTIAGGVHSHWASYPDPPHRETLWLAFESAGSDFRLVDWKLSPW
jgi:hypothetical protein